MQTAVKACSRKNQINLVFPNSLFQLPNLIKLKSHAVDKMSVEIVCCFLNNGQRRIRSTQVGNTNAKFSCIC